MAGLIHDNGVFWNVGDSTGRDNSGQSAALPNLGNVVTQGTANPPTAAPLGAPIYHKTDDDDIYIWAGGGWEGPYNKGT